MNANDTVGNQADEAQLRYLRAAEYAEQSRYQEAETEFAAVLQLSPSLHTARFQLGLLQLTCGNPGAALTTWAPLHDDSVPAFLREFSSGLEALIADDFHTALAFLHSGLDLNSVNAALNKDMEMVIHRVHSALSEGANVAPIPPAAEKSAEETVRTDFSLYKEDR